MTTPVRPATLDDVPAAAEVLAAAFADYPWTRWSIPADGYADRLVELQRIYLAHAVHHGRVWVTDTVDAVSAFLPADAPDPASEVRRRIAALHGDRLDALGGLDLPPAPAGSWLLATVGVRPDAQGAGRGTAVVRAGVDDLDGVGAVVALETSDERNVRLYRRLGFDVTATTTVADGPVVHLMVRPAALSA